MARQSLPFLELCSCPFKLVVMMTESLEIWKQHIKLNIGCCYYCNLGRELTKNNLRHQMQNVIFKMFYSVKNVKKSKNRDPQKNFLQSESFYISLLYVYCIYKYKLLKLPSLLHDSGDFSNF